MARAIGRALIRLPYAISMVLPATLLLSRSRIQKEDEFGQLTITLQGIRSHALVQLIDKSDAVLQQFYGHEVKADTTQKAQPTAASAEGDKVLAELLSSSSSSR